MFYPSFLINSLHVINAEVERRARGKERRSSISLISAGIEEKKLRFMVITPSAKQVRYSNAIWFFTPFPPFITKEVQAKIRKSFFKSHTKAFVFSLISLDYLNVIRAQLSTCAFLPTHIYFSPKWGAVTNFVLLNRHGRERVYKSLIEKKRKFAKAINLAFLSQEEKKYLISFLRESQIPAKYIVFNDVPSLEKITLVSPTLSSFIKPWPIFNMLNYVAEMERKHALTWWFEMFFNSRGKEEIHKIKTSIIEHLNKFALSLNK
jgi:hypothetical protein